MGLLSKQARNSGTNSTPKRTKLWLENAGSSLGLDSSEMGSCLMGMPIDTVSLSLESLNKAVVLHATTLQTRSEHARYLSDGLVRSSTLSTMNLGIFDAKVS